LNADSPNRFIVDFAAKMTVKLAARFTGSLAPPRSAFFLFGPRGTGKSTWIRSRYECALVFNLLLPENTLRYERDPSLFRAEVLARPQTDWIVVDEVQRVPRLLDEVHYLMEEKGYRKFVLTGSSARKLKRGSANLLAGRAILRNLYPLTAAETDFSVPAEQRLRYGSMPLSVTAEDNQPLPADWDGVLLEHLIFHEIRSYLHYTNAKGSLGYWRTPSGSEVDFVWWRGAEMVAIEVKSSRRFRPEYLAGIRALRSGGVQARSYVVHRGDQELEVDGTRVLPLDLFLRRLHGGEILG
jgi:predicted AAA+ superfamily ATPase